MGAKLVLYAANLMTVRKPRHIILIAPSPPTVEQMDASEKQRMLKHPEREEAIQTVEGSSIKNYANLDFNTRKNRNCISNLGLGTGGSKRA